MRVLLIEDDAALRLGLARRLEADGYRVDQAADGVDGLFQAQEYPVDLVIVDLGLPRLSGIDVVKRLRGEGRTMPILILTARGSWQDKVVGLEAGADDYLVKPFAAEELLARVGALAARRGAGQDYLLRIGALTLDRRAGEATRAGQRLVLPPTPFAILRLLAEAHPRALTRTELIRRLWDDDPPDSDPLRSHIHLLRQALDKPFAQPMLKTVHGLGFRLEAAE